MVAVAAMIAWLIARLPTAAHAPAFLIVASTIATSNVMSAQSLGVFRFASVQSRAALAGRYLDAVLPEDAVVIGGEQSGSVRYYTDRSIVRWDLAAVMGWISISRSSRSSRRRHLDRAGCVGRGAVPPQVSGSAAGALDWPPRVEAGTEMLMRAWRLRDREVFMRGEGVVTDRLRSFRTDRSRLRVLDEGSLTGVRTRFVTTALEGSWRWFHAQPPSYRTLEPVSASSASGQGATAPIASIAFSRSPASLLP